MTDVFSVSGTYNQQSYVQGETITATISGDDVLTQQVSGVAGPLDLTVTATDGATTSVLMPAVPVTLTTSTPESVKITGVQDTGSSPRNWTISSDGLSVSALA